MPGDPKDTTVSDAELLAFNPVEGLAGAFPRRLSAKTPASIVSQQQASPGNPSAP